MEVKLERHDVSCCQDCPVFEDSLVPRCGLMNEPLKDTPSWRWPPPRRCPARPGGIHVIYAIYVDDDGDGDPDA